MSGDSRSRPDSLAAVKRDVIEGRTTVVFSRAFEAPRDQVWSILTDPQLLRRWAPHTADRDLSTVGRAVFLMIGDDVYPDIEVPGYVLVAHRPEVLEHSWANDMLEWRLDNTSDVDGGADGCQLTLRHTLADAGMASAVAAGWHICLDVAEDVLRGGSLPAIRGLEAMNHGWGELNTRYATELGVTPSVVDGAS
jgi:uncharacterized protein YndB with AHSA1/START domain